MQQRNPSVRHREGRLDLAAVTRVPASLDRAIRASCIGVVLGAGLLLGSGPAWAADGSGTQSPLMFGTGARSQAMGRTAAAASGDAEGLFWNPARLGWLDRSDVALDKASLYGDDASHHSAYLAWPTLDLGTFAAGIQRLGVSEIERRDDRNFLLGFFGSSETHLMLGAGRRFGPHFGFGATLRVVQQRVDEAKGMGMGLDLGAAWERALDAGGQHILSAGLNFQNLLEPSLRLDEVSVQDPRNLKLGLAYQGRSKGDKFGWVVGTELDLPSRADSRFGLGAELDLNRNFFLRGGMDAGRPTFGLGLQIHGLRFAYALWSEEDLGRKDHFTLGFRFGPSTEERRQQRMESRRAEVEQRLDELLATREREAHRAALTTADGFFEQREWTSAADAYRRVLVLDPEDEHARARVDASERALARERAEIARSAGNLPLASVLYQAILERWPEDATAQRGLREVRGELARAEDRERQLNELFQHAVALFSEGDLLGSRTALDELLRIEPEHAMARELRARAESLRLTRGKESLRAARDAARRSRWEQANRELAAAERLLPERQAELASLRQQWAQAAAEQTRQMAQVSDAAGVQAASSQAAAGAAPLSAEERLQLEQRFQEGLQYFDDGKFDAAISSWQSIWDRAPEFGEVGDYLVKAYLLQGINLYSQGEYQSAMSRCRRVLDIDPSNQKARRYLARIEEEQQELEEIRGE